MVKIFQNYIKTGFIEKCVRGAPPPLESVVVLVGSTFEGVLELNPGDTPAMKAI